MLYHVTMYLFAGQSSGVDWKSCCYGKSKGILRCSQNQRWTGVCMCVKKI